MAAVANPVSAMVPQQCCGCLKYSPGAKAQEQNSGPFNCLLMRCLMNSHRLNVATLFVLVEVKHCFTKQIFDHSQDSRFLYFIS